MTILRAQVSLPGAFAGVGYDGTVNTWHAGVVVPTDPVIAASDFAGALEDMYGTTLGPNLFSQLLLGTFDVKVYNLDHPTPRVAIYESVGSDLTERSAASLPAEVAICGSYRGPYEAGVNKARRRGRIYFGPLADTTWDGFTGRPDDIARTLIRDAMNEFMVASDASDTWTWAVYSRMDDDWIGVLGGWVDNEFDTQRRRGLEVTERLTFGVGH